MKKMMVMLLMAVTIAGTSACGTKSGAGNTTGSAAETTAQAEEAVDMEKVHVAVMDVYGEDYIPVQPYDETAMKEIFGVEKSLYESYIAEGPMISVQIDQFVGIRAASGKGEEVEKLLQAYRDNLISGTLQYPMNMAKIQASEVVRFGDDVYFVMLGTPEPAEEEKGEEAALESAKKNNQLAVDAIKGFYK